MIKEKLAFGPAGHAFACVRDLAMWETWQAIVPPTWRTHGFTDSPEVFDQSGNVLLYSSLLPVPAGRAWAGFAYSDLWSDIVNLAAEGVFLYRHTPTVTFPLDVWVQRMQYALSDVVLWDEGGGIIGMLGRRTKTPGMHAPLPSLTRMVAGDPLPSAKEALQDITPWLVPSGKKPQTVSLELNEKNVDRRGQNPPGFMDQIRSYINWTPPRTLPSVMPLRDGHVPSVIAAGKLDGSYEAPDGHRYLLKGSVKRKTVNTSGLTDTGEETTSTIFGWTTSIGAWRDDGEFVEVTS